MSGSALYESFARAPLAFERGEGSWLLTASGERYLDFAAGIAVNSLGHCHPHLVAALTEQAGKLWHVSNLYEIPGQRRLGLGRARAGGDGVYAPASDAALSSIDAYLDMLEASVPLTSEEEDELANR